MLPLHKVLSGSQGQQLAVAARPVTRPCRPAGAGIPWDSISGAVTTLGFGQTSESKQPALVRGGEAWPPAPSQEASLCPGTPTTTGATTVPRRGSKLS